MNNETPVYNARTLAVVGDPADGPRGARLRLRIHPADPDKRAANDGANYVEEVLLEGEARRLHLAIRNWIRQRKALRGDTARGRARHDAKKAAYAAPAPTLAEQFSDEAKTQ